MPHTTLADSLGFLANPGQKPRIMPRGRPRVDLIHLTAAPPFTANFAETLAAVEQFRADVEDNPGVVVVDTTDDLAEKGIKVVLGLQNPPHGLTVERLQTLHEAGIRFITLAYDHRSPYGSGFMQEGGLTADGRKLILNLEQPTSRDQCDIALDLSHANHQTAREAARFVLDEGLLVRTCVTHAGCHEVYAHPRNLPDDVLSMVLAMNGYVGIPAISFFLCDKHQDALHAIAKHMKHALRLGGCVGIGSDNVYTNRTMRDAEANFDRMRQMLGSNGAFGERFPDYAPALIERGTQTLETIGTLDVPREVLGANFMEFVRSL